MSSPYYSLRSRPVMPKAMASIKTTPKMISIKWKFCASLVAEGTEDSCVRTTQSFTTLSRDVDGGIQAGRLHLTPPYFVFASTESLSIPMHGARVDWLNTRAGVYALSLSTWHGRR